MSENGSMDMPGAWIALQPMPNQRSAVGVTLQGETDFIVVELPNGDQLHIYGNGQLWMDSNFADLHVDVNWK